jgi:hypothetical protein
MEPKLIDYCLSGDDKLFSFEEYENYLNALKKFNDSNQKEWKVVDILLEDYKQICIGNTKTNKVICHFNTVDLEWDYLINIANKICDKLND